uniref:Uncharacterized protein n=1 Tax=Cyprinus carpio TaxID=7962 RepID=A0A8C1XIJ9_CYPCA
TICWWKLRSWITPTSFTYLIMGITLVSLGWSRANQCLMNLTFESPST